jgi:hypothetical protein
MVVLAALVPLTIGTEPAVAAGPPTPHCSPAPDNCSGWYRTNVTITWTWDSGGAPQDCVFTTISTDTPVAGVEVRCSVSFGGPALTSIVPIRRDATPPQVTAANPSRAPDSGGWYTKPLSVAFAGTDAGSGLASCANASYGGGDGTAVNVSGTCTDVAGNTSAPVGFGFKYDATPPSVTPTVDRPPDTKGWYRKPLSISFVGSDATSGIAACTAPARFAGPDGPQASVTGSCRDGAGNVAEAKQSFQYDATAPKLEKVKAQVAKGVARVDWARAADVAQVQLVRAPGVNGAKSTIVYQGNGAAFFDRTVKPGIRYRYEISVADVAGNVTSKAVTTASGQASTLLNPAAGTVVKKPPVLRWRAVKGAAFYNVQLYRNGVKVLSTWPKGAKLQLGRTWRYGGKQQRLSAGTYRWYVWGARGTRARPSYGKALGMSTFVVKR